jgi:hypothetical protein
MREWTSVDVQHERGRELGLLPPEREVPQPQPHAIHDAAPGPGPLHAHGVPPFTLLGAPSDKEYFALPPASVR